MIPRTAHAPSIEPASSRGNPRIVIVVVHYRDLAQTQACLAALGQLRGASAEIVVVDNSPDGEARTAFDQTDVEVLATGRNLGFAGGCNLALRALRAQSADYIWLVNSDARVESDCLDALLRTAQTNPRAGAIGCVLRDPDRPHQIEAFGGGRVNWWMGHIRHIRNSRQRLDYLTGASLLLRCAAIDEIGLFDEAFFFLGEDVDLCVRLRQAGWELCVAEGAHVWHGGTGREPLASPFRTEWYVAAVVRLLRKHGRAAMLTTLPILGYSLGRGVASGSPALLRAAWHGWRRGWTTPV